MQRAQRGDIDVTATKPRLPAEVCESERRDGERSSRRDRTLVTQMALRGLSGKKIERALISIVARSNEPLQSEAGYIDARPKAKSTKLLATHGRTIHWGHPRRMTDVAE